MLIDTAKCANGCRALRGRLRQGERLNLQTKPRRGRGEVNQQRAIWIRKVKVRDNLTVVSPACR